MEERGGLNQGWRERREFQMKRLFILGAISSAAMLSPCWAATNLNSSTSNTYRLIYDTEIVRPAQASALLAGLERLGPADEARLKRWLPANFKKHGVQGDRIKKIVFLPASKARKRITVIFLKDANDETQALAVSDEGASGPKKPGTQKN